MCTGPMPQGAHRLLVTPAFVIWLTGSKLCASYPVSVGTVGDIPTKHRKSACMMCGQSQFHDCIQSLCVCVVFFLKKIQMACELQVNN